MERKTYLIRMSCKYNLNDVVFTKKTIFDNSTCDRTNSYSKLRLNLNVCKTGDFCYFLYL